MTLKVQLGIAIAVIAMAVPAAYSRNQDRTGYSRGEIRRMIRDAHTSDQYRTLAAYFRERQEALDQSAQKEREEWLQEARGMTFSMAPKYPRPVDASRSRYEYFAGKAYEMGQKASYFEGLAPTADKPSE